VPALKKKLITASITIKYTHSQILSSTAKSLKEHFKKLVEKVMDSFPPDIFHRAINYLYTKKQDLHLFEIGQRP